MRLMRIKLPILATLLTGMVALGQQPAQNPVPAPKAEVKPPAKADPNSLETLIADALKSHPDIRVAEAKLRDAEAILNQTRFQVIQAVTAAHGAVQAAKAMLDITELVHAKQADLFAKGQTSDLELKKAQLDVARARADHAKIAGELQLLTGRLQQRYLIRAAESWLRADPFVNEYAWNTPPARSAALFTPPDGVVAWEFYRATAAPTTTPGTMTARIRIALDKPAKLDTAKDPQSFRDAIEFLQKKAGTDVPVRFVINNSIPQSVDLMAGELPLSAWLQVIEDSVPGLVIVVRDYGLLVTTRDRVPDSAVRLRDFLRSTEQKKEAPKSR